MPSLGSLIVRGFHFLLGALEGHVARLADKVEQKAAEVEQAGRAHLTAAAEHGDASQLLATVQAAVRSAPTI